MRNGAEYIAETVRSVVQQSAVQSGRVRLDYTVLDCQSSDSTVSLASEAAGGHAEIISEPDEGMYDALARGFAARTGDICGYLNAGDLLLPGALDALLAAMGPGGASWVCGYQAQMTESGVLHGVVLPFRFERSALRRGLHTGLLPFVQQESTYWRGDLMRRVDLERLASFRLAGDFFLWHSFAQVADLVIIDAMIGAFRVHPGQQSSAMQDYMSEVRQLAGPPTRADRARAAVERLAWRAPVRIKKLLNPDHLWLYDEVEEWWS